MASRIHSRALGDSDFRTGFVISGFGFWPSGFMNRSAEGRCCDAVGMSSGAGVVQLAVAAREFGQPQKGVKLPTRQTMIDSHFGQW